MVWFECGIVVGLCFVLLLLSCQVCSGFWGGVHKQVFALSAFDYGVDL